MLVLAVDSATNAAGAAVVSEEGILGEFFLNTEKTHSEKLMPLIDQLLRDTGLDLQDIGGIAVSIGPGSFTGLRIGLAAVKGLALFLDKPVVGIPSLDGLARNISPVSGLLCPVIYARRDEVYSALYIHTAGGIERISHYMAVSPRRLVSLLENLDNKEVIFIGDGLDIFPQDLRDSLGPGCNIAGREHRLTRASTIGFLGLEKLKAGKKDNLDDLVPFYIRASAAETRWKSNEKKA
ncbi:MAG: tRNA (adenosine(37)-N6)-threonylcarbamoyltransferase complex dimerization subunit type 1 TsaB [Clostridia bacterium]|nr:tRNA (adenosine(37)-N6)-threonylcarbamoyltransferase complex dimerization subunit type 1 TsaB [Clostridia bacterium]